jgi:signal transduction histidine kinase
LESDLFLMQCGIIHDLRNQITVITGMLALMEHRLSGQTALDANSVAGIKTELMTAQRGANVCIAMTTRQLDLVRSVANTPDDDQSSVYEVAKDIADSLLFHPDARHCSFKVSPPPPALPACEISGTTVFQLLLNLVLNAAQARKPTATQNEITISLTTTHEKINVAQCVDTASSRWIGLKTFKNQPPLVRLSIQDNGTGIKPEVLTRMFVQNYSTKRSGTGVGLLLVAKLCTDNQVLLHVSTQVNIGTTISIYLPTLPPRPRTAAPFATVGSRPA